VQAATLVLPRSTRDRYRQEFVAELYGLSRTRQLRHAAGVLSRSWALRAAISGLPGAAADIEIVFPRRRRRPLYCRLIRHYWVDLSSEDGSSRYRECARCGKEANDSLRWARMI
jgi:hypothetical protein